ncbi:Choloylglycine hydrolase [Desulfovibrio sp. X2]|uniref:linear amide C-N hydrolase n=1 Tax=Desulfovibrio sp. X2 TaxID=941449 RepID=UPI000358E83D|nr:choloylglycine hydrolase family protein [Desulfovibrio sp. X2]EPR44486.1 Choloylglycine hydrolase [Desulfovibrio sp. X2]
MPVVRIVLSFLSLLLLLSVLLAGSASACTGVRLIAKNGDTVYGRTMEWGTFDLESRVAVVPRGHAFAGLTPDGPNGKRWKGAYGFVALDMLHKEIFADGMNEKGLTVGLFYHPGFETYPVYERAKAGESITATDVVSYILSQCAGVDEALAAMKKVRVVPVVEPSIGIPVEGHWMVTEPSGKSVVIEFHDHVMHVYDNPLGVITNSPGYDWHMTNLRNYVNLSAVAVPTKRIEDMNFKPLGGGSGMIGLPGDFTPPSRFVRAVAWSQTARPLPDAGEAVYELFRILDNFDVPLGASEGPEAEGQKGMRSDTQWTTAWDTADKVFYFHTQHNRRVREVDLKRLDFAGTDIRHIPMDARKAQDVKDITDGNS